MRRLLAVAAASALLAAAPSAPSPGTEPGPASEAAEIAGGIGPGLPEAPRREICTPLGCLGVRTARWSSVAGFAAAVLAAGWLARRRAGPGARIRKRGR